MTLQKRPTRLKAAAYTAVAFVGGVVVNHFVNANKKVSVVGVVK